MAQLSQPDDNMIPGQTYTFQLKSTNWITLPSTDTVHQDLVNNAPSFVGDLQVTSPLTTPIYNCQFTYDGDGTDVIMDVANSLVAACQQGSGDSFTFVGAVADTAQSITVTPGTAMQKLVDTVGDAVNKTTQGAANDIAQAAQKVLTPVEVAVAILVGLVVLLIFTSGKAGGVSASETGLNIGGSK